MQQIADDLRLVIPVTYDATGDPVIYAYHTPISHAVFQANFAVIARTNAAIFKEGFAYAQLSGITTAAMELKEQAEKYAAERGILAPDGKSFMDMAKPILTEIERLTLILAPTPQGWQELPVSVAINQGHIKEEDWQEAESQLVFFSVSYAVESRHRKIWRMKILADLIFGSHVTSLAPTAWIDFLLKSRKEENSEKEEKTEQPKAVSSVPI